MWSHLGTLQGAVYCRRDVALSQLAERSWPRGLRRVGSTGPCRAATTVNFPLSFLSCSTRKDSVSGHNLVTHLLGSNSDHVMFHLGSKILTWFNLV